MKQHNEKAREGTIAAEPILRMGLINDQGKGLQLSLARRSASCAPCETRRSGLGGRANLYRISGGDPPRDSPAGVAFDWPLRHLIRAAPFLWFRKLGAAPCALESPLPFVQINIKPSLRRRPTVRKYITPGSARIYGLPGIDNNFGVRDNGSGQIWSESKRVGSINYWTGDVVLAKELIPKIRFRGETLILFGLKSAALPNVSCKYEMSYLDIENKAEPRTTGLRYHWS